MPSGCEFELDQPNAVYCSGQTITGTIKLTTTTDKKVRHVRIELLGEGNVFWDESDSSSDFNGVRTAHVNHYTSREVYVNNQTYVRGAGVLPLGSHTYTFSSSLPAQCPSSCEGMYGQIRYRLSLILDRPFHFNVVFHKQLTVWQTVDLNLNPTLKLPLLAEEIGSVCCGPFSCGTILYSLQLPLGVYSPGQTVTYSLCIHNQSMADTTGYSLKFTQKMTFTAHSLRRKQCQQEKVLLQQRSNDRCLRWTNSVFEGQVRIPFVAPTSDPSSIIYVEYMLKATIHMSGCHRSTDLHIPIFIGNIRLEEIQPSSQVAETERTQNSPEARDKLGYATEPPGNEIPIAIKVIPRLLARTSHSGPFVVKTGI